MTVADWNRDGKLDLVIGTIDGAVWFVPNESHDKKLQFGGKVAVMAGDGEVQTTGDAGPLVADWDGDGIPDLLVGSADGSVVLYRGSGKTGVPVLGDEETLIPPLPQDSDNEVKVERDPATGKLSEPKLDRPGIRTKLAVYDWNGDGKLDLLVGDVVSTVAPEPELGEAQKKEKEALEARRQSIAEEMSSVYESAHEQAQRDSKDVENEVDEDAVDRLQEATNAIVSKDERYRALSKESEAIWTKLKPLSAERATHGFVWVYARTADVPPPSRAVADSDATQLPPDSKDAILAFRVLAKETGKPLRSVAINVIPRERQEDGYSWRSSKRSKGTIHESLRPDEQGRVEFVVPSGVGFDVRATDSKQFGEERATQEVTALTAGERRELRLSIPTEEDLVYQARVVRASDDTPVPGAHVRLIASREYYGGTGNASRRMWSTEKLGETSTDADGRFRIGTMSWKRAHLRIESEGFAVRVVVPAPGHDSPATAEAVKLEPQATLHARVLDASGKALPEVTLVLSAKGYSLTRAGKEDDDSIFSSGEFELPDEEWTAQSGPDGACVLQGILPGVQLTVLLTRDGATLRKDPVGLTLKPGEQRDLEWKVGSGCTLKGIATDQDGKPVAGQRILLSATPGRGYFQPYESDEIVASTTTDDAGRFVFADVSKGSWSLGPAARPFGEKPDANAVAPMSQTVEVNDGGTQEIEVHAWRGRYVTGTVLAPDGSKAKRPYVTAKVDKSSHLTDVNGNEDGTFTLGPLGPGAMDLIAQAFDLYAPSEPFRVEAGAKDVVLRLRDGGRIRANVVDAKTGAACVAEVMVTMESAPKESDESSWSTRTKDDGTFDRGGMTPGRYSLGARTRDGRFGFLRGIDVGTQKDPASLRIPVSPGGKLRLRYEGKKEQVFVAIAAQGVDVAWLDAPLKPGSPVESAAPSGTVTLKIHREFPGEPRTKDVTVAPGETKDVVLGDED